MDRRSPFAWIVVARPDVAFADEIPADRACVPPGGRRVHVPWFHSRGGANDRFKRWLHLGGRRGVPRPLRLPLRQPRVGGWGGLRGNDPAWRGLVREGAALAPAQETRRDRSVVTVQFRVLSRSSESSFDDRDRSPDTRLAGSPFNPSRGRWSDASAELGGARRYTSGPRGGTGGAVRRRRRDRSWRDAGGTNARLEVRIPLGARAGGREGGLGRSVGPAGSVRSSSPGWRTLTWTPTRTPTRTTRRRGPEDLGMTGAARGKSKAGHHVTWLVSRARARRRRRSSRSGCLVFVWCFSGWRLRSSHPGSSRRGFGTTGRFTPTGERNASESGATATRCENEPVDGTA